MVSDTRCRVRHRIPRTNERRTSWAPGSSSSLSGSSFCCSWRGSRSTRSAPPEVGLVTKRFAFRKLAEDNPIAFHGEAGYQADAADAGAALQALADLRREEVPVGAGAGGRDRRGDRAGRRAAADRREERGVQARVRQLLRPRTASSSGGGQKGVQRPVLPPGTLLPIHPVAFLVLTPQTVYGLPVSPDLVARRRGAGSAHARSRSGSRPSSCRSS